MMAPNSGVNCSQSENQGTVIVKGRINGSILHAKKVVITDSGYFQGTVVSDSIEVFGVLSGNIESGSIEVFPSGRLNCESVQCDNILLHEGGTVIRKDDREYSHFDRSRFEQHTLCKPKPQDLPGDMVVSKPVIEIEGADCNAAGKQSEEKPTFYSSI